MLKCRYFYIYIYIAYTEWQIEIISVQLLQMFLPPHFSNTQNCRNKAMNLQFGLKSLEATEFILPVLLWVSKQHSSMSEWDIKYQCLEWNPSRKNKRKKIKIKIFFVWTHFYIKILLKGIFLKHLISMPAQFSSTKHVICCGYLH